MSTPVVHQYPFLYTRNVCSYTIRKPHGSTTAKLHVAKGNSINLLSFATAQELNFLHVSVNTLMPLSLVAHQKSISAYLVELRKYKDGWLNYPIDPLFKPKRQPHRRIPFYIRKDVEKELESLEILNTNRESSWSNPMGKNVKILLGSCWLRSKCISQQFF
jgi:hypothetical protein